MADNGSKTTTTAPKGEPWKVLDTTALEGQGKRTHTIVVDGRPIPYSFEFAQELPMPEAHAKKFAHDPAFHVLNPEGKRFKPAVSITRGFDKDGKLVLAEDECVARLEELSMESLLDRAIALPGGERLNLKTGKKAVIKFLIDARKKKLTANLSPEKRESDGEVEEMDDSDLARLRLDELAA